MYLWISLFEVNKFLFLTVNKFSEKMYWEYNVIISMFLNASLTLVLVMILTIFFRKINIFLTLEDLPRKIMP